MIISKDLTLKLKLPVTNEQIESELKEIGVEVIRWAITDVNENNNFTLRVSFIK